MDFQELKAWLIFQRLPSLSLSLQHELLSVFGSPQAVLALEEIDFLPKPTQSAIRQLQQQSEQHGLAVQAEAILARSCEQNVKLVCLNDERYPALLKEIHRPPLLLYLKGRMELLSSPQLAVVGSRRATALAKQTTQLWCEQLAKAGMTITSGLALGIDTCAHEGALRGEGATIAVLAHGLDKIYPPRNQKLAGEIAECGLLVSEFAFGEPPRREHFPQRNRLISGLSLAVWVVEAAQRSGSLITARYAMEQGRDVFATPGAINNGLAMGCHQLIKQGALLVDSCDDILQALALPISFALGEQQKITAAKPALSELAARILTNMSGTPMHINEISQLSGIDVALLASELIMLEVEGKIANQAGYYQKLL